MKDGFGAYHPLANLIFFVSVITVTMFTDDPVMLGVSLFGAVCYGVLLKGRRGAVSAIKSVMILVIFTAVLNPLFNHAGVTVLFRMPSGNAFTLEAVLFGISAGGKLAAVFMWFLCLNQIVTSDKIIYLFGRVSPYFALALSLILGFVPVIKNKFRMCYEAQAQFGESKMITASRCMLSTAGWAIEEAADTALSMHGRGFGLKGRTSFHLFIMERKDVLFIAICAAAFGALVFMKITGTFDFYYYPYVKSFGNSSRLWGALVYGAICLMPEWIYMTERRRTKGAL